MSRHIGNILENAIRKSEYPISKLAKRIGYTRQHMYNIFQQAKVDLLLLEEIGKVINYDFTDDVRELKKYSAAIKDGYGGKEISPGYENLEKKYITLLEEYNKLLKEHSELLKKAKTKT